MRFKEYITEVMQPANVDFDKDAQKDGWRYHVFFTIEKIPYVVSFYPTGITALMRDRGITRNAWSVQFNVVKKKSKFDIKGGESDRPDFKMQNFNNGIEYKLMPLVLGYIEGFINSVSPDSLKVLADKSEKSRVSLYSKLLRRNEKRFDDIGYKIDSHEFGKDEVFLIIKKGLS